MLAEDRGLPGRLPVLKTISFRFFACCVLHATRLPHTPFQHGVAVLRGAGTTHGDKQATLRRADRHCPFPTPLTVPRRRQAGRIRHVPSGGMCQQFQRDPPSAWIIYRWLRSRITRCDLASSRNTRTRTPLPLRWHTHTALAPLPLRAAAARSGRNTERWVGRLLWDINTRRLTISRQAFMRTACALGFHLQPPPHLSRLSDGGHDGGLTPDFATFFARLRRTAGLRTYHPPLRTARLV